MSNSNSANATVIQFPGSREDARDSSALERLDVLAGELQAALKREESLREEIGDLVQRRDALTQECESRVTSGLKAIASLLSLQCRAAKTPETAAQLSIAARRVAALGRVHCRVRALA
jgi:two-component sensor histidine kinase